MNRFVSGLSLLLGAVLLSPGFAATQEREQRVKMNDLPPVVQQTIREQSKGAKIEEIFKEIEDGKTVYSVEFVVNEHTREVLIGADGRVLAIEDEIALDALPPAVKATFEKQAGNGKLVKAESITRNGAVIGYEGHIKKGGKLTEIKASPDGKLMSKE